MTGNLAQFDLAQLSHRLVAEPDLAQALGESARQQVAEHGLQFGGRTFALLRMEEFEGVHIGHEIQAQVVARLPIGGDLQDRRAAETAMGDQQIGTEAGPVAAAFDRQGHAAEVLQALVMLAAEGQRNESGAHRQYSMAELAGQVVAEAGRAHARYRQAARGDDEGRAFDLAKAGLDAERAVPALHLGDAAAGIDAHSGLRALVEQHGHDLL